MRQERDNRRWSERILKITEQTSKVEVATGQRSNEGNDKPSNSFFVLSEPEIVENP
jgi:hypothetical protein